MDEQISQRMRSGEFSDKGSTKEKVTRPVRKFLASLPFNIGRPLAFQLAKIGWGWQQEASKRMPVAAGDPRIVAGLPVIIPLEELYKVYGPVFQLSFGVKSIVIVSDAAIAKEILMTNAQIYNKGILSEILEFLMGTGLIPANGEVWKRRRRTVVPSLHRKYLDKMVQMFYDVTQQGIRCLNDQLDTSVDMENFFSRLTLDIIGKGVFNSELSSLQKDDPIIEAVYTALRETEHRSTFPFPYWDIAILRQIVPRQRELSKALKIINTTLDDLITKSKKLVEQEDLEFNEEFLSAQDPSILHFLIASGDEINSKQLRDDLMTLLVAGHETTAAVLTWTFYLLSNRPDIVAKIRKEVDSIVGDEIPTIKHLQELKFTTRVINESMRLYPQPPILIRRAMEDTFLGNYFVGAGSDIFIAVWNMHRSETYWKNPLEFNPDRFPISESMPDENNCNFAYLPFGGGKRKCIGDKFALFEAIMASALLIQKFDFKLNPDAPPVKMATGATIHTTEGLNMLVSSRCD